MMLLVLLVPPLAGAALLARARGPAAAALHAATTVLTLTGAAGTIAAVVMAGPVTALDGLLRADALSAWMIALIAGIAGLAAIEAPHDAPFAAPRRFYPLFHLFVFTMLLAVSTNDVGLMWVAVEGTTLASVFLVNFEGTRTSLEASYKYLLICSVGIALAFLGTLLVYFADVSQAAGAGRHPLAWTELLEMAPRLDRHVVQLAFAFLLVGYGTKAGLAPMHTWLPDAHSEAPAPVSAIMSGVLLSVGLYAVMRFRPVVDLAAGGRFAGDLLVGFGLASMGVAAAFLWRPRNLKRMLAYSSVEHMGIVCLGLGFGGPWGVAGALLHIANHALAKSVLFLLAGRIRAAYGSAVIAEISGLLGRMPTVGRVFVAAMLALIGLPPFGLFVSEVMIFGAGFHAGFVAAPLAGLGLLVIAFAGMLRALHGMLYGSAPLIPAAPASRWYATLPLVAALAVLVLAGVAWPPGLAAALGLAASLVSRG
ncbi:MAG TPA: proton-conducting transporter membrane subunit [Candidatus Limnocylindrales bacterium]|nr:proton-conducting transporter membrane subunit [Candidatus Limnocylindrales bacterium]